MAHTFANRKPTGHIDKACCSACHSPILPCAGIKLSKAACFHDDLDHYWCVDHTIRGQLLNWGKANGFPYIAFVGASGTRYAFGAMGAKVLVNEVMWELAILCGQNDAVIAAARYVGAIKDKECKYE